MGTSTVGFRAQIQLIVATLRILEVVVAGRRLDPLQAVQLIQTWFLFILGLAGGVSIRYKRFS